MIPYKQGAKKSVTIRAHEIDCLPGHVFVTATGSGSCLRVALQRAIAGIADQLRKKHVGSFKAAVVVNQ